MKGFRGIPRVLKVNSVDGFIVNVLFSNGESRVIDFEVLLRDILKLQPGQIGYGLLTDPEKFAGITLENGMLVWPSVGSYSKDFYGERVFYPFDIDPVILFENSELDPNSVIDVGAMIKEKRLTLGLSQEKLAHLSGTTKHYISRLENNRTDIELLTLKRIVEAGLGMRLSIEVK
jgi:DNA-binding XRE family transcriptional regulator